MGQRVLVTGGTGFVGANLVRQLVSRGDEVVCATRPSSPQLCLQGLPVEQRHINLWDVDDVAKNIKGVDGIYHCAGTFDPGPGGVAKMKSIHVDATRTLCDAALKVGAKRLVLCSSSVTVGFGSRANPGNEETPFQDVNEIYGPRGPLRAYYDSKLESERLVQAYVERGLETVIVNPDYVIGAWDIKPTSGAMILQMRKHRIPFHPSGGKCFVDADDCAQAHVLAMEKGRPGERYLLGNENLSYREFMSLIAKEVGKKPPAMALPSGVSWSLGKLGALLSRVRPHAAAGLDPWVLRSMGQERYRSAAKAREELGMDQTPISTSIQKALDWFLEHGYCD